MLGFQHPFVSKVTSNRALRELVAEAKAEVMEEIEESRDEAEEDDSSESASVSSFTIVAVLGERAWQLFQPPKAGLDHFRWRQSGCLARGWILGAVKGMEKQQCWVVAQCLLTGGAGEKGLKTKRNREKKKENKP